MSPETLKMVREALGRLVSCAYNYRHNSAAGSDVKNFDESIEQAIQALQALQALEAATPAGPSEREKAEFRRGVEEGIRWADINVMRPEDSITDCVNRAIAALPPAPTDKESK